MSKDNYPYSGPSKRTPRRRATALGLVTAALLAGASTVALLPGGGKDSRSKDRVALATQPFSNPSIKSVRNAKGSDELGPNRERVLVTVSLPENPKTEKLRQEYASNNTRKSIIWLPYGIETAAVLDNGTNKKPTLLMGAMPSAEATFGGAIPITPKGNEATIEIDPLKSDPNGTKTALFVEVEDFDAQGNKVITTIGHQYIGTLTREHGHWQIDTQQPSIADFSATTSQANYAN